MSQLGVTIDNLKIAVGDALTPAIVGLIDTITPVIRGIIEWIQNNETLASVIAGIVLGVVGLAAALTVLAFVVTGLTAATSAFGTVFAIAFAPITLIVVALIALGVGVHFLVQHLGGWKNIIQVVAEFSVKAMNQIINAFEVAINWIIQAAGKIATFTRDIFTNTINSIIGFVEDGINFFIMIVNKYVKLYNDIAKFIPGISEIGEVAKVSLDRLRDLGDVDVGNGVSFDRLNEDFEIFTEKAKEAEDAAGGLQNTLTDGWARNYLDNNQQLDIVPPDLPDLDELPELEAPEDINLPEEQRIRSTVEHVVASPEVENILRSINNAQPLGAQDQTLRDLKLSLDAMSDRQITVNVNFDTSVRSLEDEDRLTENIREAVRASGNAICQ